MDIPQTLNANNENKFEKLDDCQKKITLGKLKQLETVVDLLNCMRESLTRELYVNGVECEDDIINPTSTKQKCSVDDIDVHSI